MYQNLKANTINYKKWKKRIFKLLYMYISILVNKKDNNRKKKVNKDNIKGRKKQQEKKNPLYIPKFKHSTLHFYCWKKEKPTSI